MGAVLLVVCERHLLLQIECREAISTFALQLMIFTLITDTYDQVCPETQLLASLWLEHAKEH